MPSTPPLSTARLVAALVAALLLAGCATQRHVTVRTNPPGARVWINGVEQAQRTPIRIPFVHYGPIELRLEKKGYRPIATDLTVPTQLDGYPVIDLPLELAVRERAFNQAYRMEPLPPKPTRGDAEGVLERARSMRGEAERLRNAPVPGVQR